MLVYCIIPAVYFRNNINCIITTVFSCKDRMIDSFKPKHVTHYLYIYIGVSKPMSQTLPGYSQPQLKQKSSYRHGSKSEKVSRYRLPSMCQYPFEYYIRCSKCCPFAATHPLLRHIMGSLTRSS
jgi:hypothetical protein